MLSLLKDVAMIDYTETLKFLITNELDNSILVKSLARLSCFSLNNFYIEFPIVYIYNKLPHINKYEETENVCIPSKTFVIFFRDFSYQIFLPFDKADGWAMNTNNYKILLPVYPPIIHNKDYSEVLYYPKYFHNFTNLSNTEKVRDEKDEFYIVSPVEPILLEYTEEEHEKLKKEYNLRR
jgi:hypothetical protein